LARFSEAPSAATTSVNSMWRFEMFIMIAPRGVSRADLCQRYGLSYAPAR
jgi:hypothetical protein